MSTPSYSLASFSQDVRSSYSAERPETFWECEPAVKRLLAGGAVQAWVNEQLTALRDNPESLGDWGAKEVVLHRDTGWAVSVALFDTPRRYIHVLPYFAFYAPLAGANLAANRYKLPADFRHEVFDPAVRLEPAGFVDSAPGNVLAVRTDQFAYDFHVAAPLPVLRFATAPLRSLEWLFSKTTLQAWQANDATVTYTQLRVASAVLGKIAHQSSIAPLRRLASHPHHAVRWAAIQNLGRLSRSEALARIREAVNDPHPHVRRAAQKTLDQLERRAGR